MTGNENFTTVKALFLAKLNSTPVDIYLKLSSQKFVKIINKNELYTSTIIQKYLDRGIVYLYLMDRDFDEFMNFYTKSTITCLDEAKKNEPPIKEVIDLQLRCHEIVQLKLSSIGISPDINSVIKFSIDKTVQILNATPEITAILLNIAKKEGEFIYEHSLMLAYLCGAITHKIDWQSEYIKVKVSLAAMMHDISLDNHHYAKQIDMNPSDLQNLAKKEQDNYLKHSIQACEFVKKLKHFPPDVDQIVLQSHELPDGTGFPKGLKNQTISPLGALFVTAHTFINYLYKYDFSPLSKEIALTNMSDEYSKGHYKIPFQSLIEIMTEFDI